MNKVRIAIVVLAVALLGSGCSQSAAVDRVGLYYDHGPIEGNHFNRVVEPGTGTTLQGISDAIVWLPINQRNYIVSKTATEGDRKGNDFIKIPAKGGIDMDFEVSVYFKLNTHTNDIKGFKGGTLRRFYEQICKKYDCASDGGWDKMLNDNFRKLIETSMRQKVFNYTVEELFANAAGVASGDADAILKIQAEIASTIKENINTVLGGQYFCGPQFDRKKSECPDFEFIINSATPADPKVIASFSAQRIALNNVITAQNNAQARKAEAEGTRAAADATQAALTPAYIDYLRAQAMQKCAERAGCTMIVTPEGSNVNVNAR